MEKETNQIEVALGAMGLEVVGERIDVYAHVVIDLEVEVGVHFLSNNGASSRV